MLSDKTNVTSKLTPAKHRKVKLPVKLIKSLTFHFSTSHFLNIVKLIFDIIVTIIAVILITKKLTQQSQQSQ